ncbi:hypothetical protein KFL_002200150 [Klebsormidium nitens]|uniref:SAP domain-containing protein n=1 Tax=Klebsormidium nitens TaxID=105231 RepID=A0A1Y1I2H7_KLENI|nr:hypothetical protein KFL_002200150 [Klebsormidium nitens]|eukprot:GAQ85130.1 hypothetical protein KFL_002200150 [Klebsormidium nitens]
MAAASSPVPGVSKAADPKTPGEASPAPQFKTPASSVPPPQAQTSRDPPSGTSFKALPCGEDVETMSVRQLREALKERGLNSHGLLEKREFQDLLRAHLPPITPERADATPATASVSDGTAEQMPAADESVAHAGASTPLASKPSDKPSRVPNGPLEGGGAAAGRDSLDGTPLKEDASKTSASPPSGGSTATPTDSSDPLPKTPSATPPGEGIPPSNWFKESRVDKAPQTVAGRKKGTQGEETQTTIRPRRTGRRVRFTPMMQGRPRAPVFRPKAEQEGAEEREVLEHEVEVTVLEGLQGSANKEKWIFQRDEKGHLRSQSGTRSESDSGSERRSRAKRARGKAAEARTANAPGSGRRCETKTEGDVGRKAVKENDVVGPRRSSLGSNSDSVKAQGGAGAARVKETARRGRGAEEDSDSSSDDDSESDSGSGSSSGSGDDSSSSEESESEVEGAAQTPSNSAGGAAESAIKENGGSNGDASPVSAAKQMVETGVKPSPVRGSEQDGIPERRERGRPRRVVSKAAEQAGASEPARKRGRPVGRPGGRSTPQKAPGSRKPRAVGLKTKVKRFWTSVRARARAQEQNASILRRSRKLWRLKTAPADQAAEARKRRIEARKAKAGEDDKAFALANRQKRLEALQAKALARRAAAKLRAEKAAAKKAAAAHDPATAKERVPSTKHNPAPGPRIDPGMQKRRRPSVSILEAAVKRQAARNLEVGKGEPLGEAPRESDEGSGFAGAGSRFWVPEPEVQAGADGKLAPGVSERVATAGISAQVRGEPGGSPRTVKLSPVQAKSVPRKKRTGTRPGVKPKSTDKPPDKLTPKQAREGLPGRRAVERRTDGFVKDDSEEEAEKATAKEQVGAADAVGIAGLSPEKEPAKAPVKKRVTGKRAARKRPTAKTNGKENVLPPELAAEKRKEQSAASPEAGARKVKPLGDVYVKDEEVRVQKRAILKEAKARRFAVERTPLRRTDRLRKKAPSAVPGAEEPRLQPDAPTESGATKSLLEADVRTDGSPLATGRTTRGGGLKAGPQKKGAVDARAKVAKAGKKEVKAGKMGLRRGASQGSDAAADVSIAAGEIRTKVGTAGKKRRNVETPAADTDKAPHSSGKKRRFSGELSATQAAMSGAKGKLARRKDKSREQPMETESDDEVVGKKRKGEKEIKVKRKAAESEGEDEERARKRRRKEKARASRGEESDEEEHGRKHRGKHKRRHKHGRKHRRHKHRDEGESESEHRRRKHKRKRGETEEERKQRRAERRERKGARREARRADKAENESEGRAEAGDASGDGGQESDGAREQPGAEASERKRVEPEAAAAEASDPGHEETRPKRTPEASEEKDGQTTNDPGDRTSVDSDKAPVEMLKEEAVKEAGPQANAAEETIAQKETGGSSRPGGVVEKNVEEAHESPPVGTPSGKVVREVERGTEPEAVVSESESTGKGPVLETSPPAESKTTQPAWHGFGASINGGAQSPPRERTEGAPTAFSAGKETSPPPEAEVAPREDESAGEPEPATEQGAALVAPDSVDKESGAATISPGTMAPAKPTREKADAGEEESGSDVAEESEKSEEEEWESAALDALLKFESGKLNVDEEATPQSKLKRSDVHIAEEKDGVTSVANSGAPQKARSAPVTETEVAERTEVPASPAGGEQSASSAKSAPGTPPRAEPPVADVESVLDWVAAKGRCNLADVSGNFAGTAPSVLEGLLQDLLGSFDIGVDNGHYFVL